MNFILLVDDDNIDPAKMGGNGWYLLLTLPHVSH